MVDPIENDHLEQKNIQVVSKNKEGHGKVKQNNKHLTVIIFPFRLFNLSEKMWIIEKH